MPKRYEKLRDKFAKQGDRDPKGKAARIFNATRKKSEKPVTGKHKGKK